MYITQAYKFKLAAIFMGCVHDLVYFINYFILNFIIPVEFYFNIFYARITIG